MRIEEFVSELYKMAGEGYEIDVGPRINSDGLEFLGIRDVVGHVGFWATETGQLLVNFDVREDDDGEEYDVKNDSRKNPESLIRSLFTDFDGGKFDVVDKLTKLLI